MLKPEYTLCYVMLCIKPTHINVNITLEGFLESIS